jgi:hypothetical protein
MDELSQIDATGTVARREARHSTNCIEIQASHATDWWREQKPD